MSQKIKTTIRKFWNTAIIALVAVFIAGAANAQSNIAKTAKLLNLNEQYELNLADDTKSTSDFKIEVSENGNLTITFETFANNAYATLFNKDGTSLEPIKSDVVSGNSYYTSLRWANNTYSQGLVLSWDANTEQFKGSFVWGIDAGTYYLRSSRSPEGLSSAKLSISLESKTQIEERLQAQKAEQERQLQAQKAGRAALLTLIGLGAFIVLMIVIAIRSHQKAKERKKEYQPMFVNIFKEKGLSSTDIMWTNCKQIIRKNTREYIVNNIVFGVKNDILSVFGGGSWRVNFGVEDEKIAFGMPKWKRLLKETDDILLSDGFVAKILFPKKEEKKFKHLFDIPISNIEIIEGKERGKKIELFIEYSDNLVTISPYCNNNITAIETANTIIDVFDKMMNGTLSKAKIYKANLTINDAFKKDAKITEKRNLKILGAVVGTAVAIGGAAAVSGARNWSKDR